MAGRHDTLAMALFTVSVILLISAGDVLVVDAHRHHRHHGAPSVAAPASTYGGELDGDTSVSSTMAPASSFDDEGSMSSSPEPYAEGSENAATSSGESGEGSVMNMTSAPPSNSSTAGNATVSTSSTARSPASSASATTNDGGDGSPLEACDFYFDGHRNDIPEIKLIATGVNVYNTTGGLMRKDGVDYKPVAVANSIGCEVRLRGNYLLDKCHHRLFARGRFLSSEEFNVGTKEDFLDTFIKVLIGSAQLLDGGNYNNGTTDDRACVIVKTDSAFAN